MKCKLFITMLLAAVVLTGCDALLEIKPISEISNDNYWKSEGDVKGYVNGIYNKYRALANKTLYGTDRGEEMAEGHVGLVSKAWGNQLRAADGYSWLDLYELIHHTNMVIKYAPDISFNYETEKNSLIAQAYFFRAKLYLMLIQNWGEAAIVLEPTESHKGDMPARSPAADVMKEVILPDIETALGLFPVETITDRNRVSKSAVYCLKGESLAWKYKVIEKGNGSRQDLVDGIAALDEAEKGGVSLLGDFAAIFDNNNKANDEIIFAVYMKREEWGTGMYANSISPSILSIGGAVNMDDIPFSYGGSAKHDYAPSDELQAYLNKYPNDQRKDATFVGAVDAGGKVFLVSQNKFRGRILDDDRVFDDDIPIYRLADVILLKAEMYADMGETASAVGELNRVRGRAGIGDYTGATDQATLRREILEERSRELAFENKRWPDLLRAHFSGVIDVYSVVPNLRSSVITDKTPLYFPITEEMMNLNPNLKQTDGY